VCFCSVCDAAPRSPHVLRKATWHWLDSIVRVCAFCCTYACIAIASWWETGVARVLSLAVAVAQSMLCTSATQAL
jgi:hypothetical protein